MENLENKLHVNILNNIFSCLIYTQGFPNVKEKKYTVKNMIHRKTTITYDF